MRTSRTVIGLVTLATALVALATPWASAAESGYRNVVSTFGFGQSPSFAGGYVSCPDGMRAVSSGAHAGHPEGYLTAGLTTFDKLGGYATAWGWDNRTMSVTAACVDRTRLRGSTLSTGTLRSPSRTRYQHQRTVPCPTGTVPYGGGAFTSYQGVARDGIATYASRPTGTGWQYAGAGSLGNGELTMSSHCLPRERLGTIVTVTDSDTSSSAGGYSTLLANARCPEGYFAYTGGAWYHTATSSPAWRGYLTSSSLSADDRGWSTVGRSFAPDTTLTAVAKCTNRLGTVG